jgi:hypothetical protein
MELVDGGDSLSAIAFDDLAEFLSKACADIIGASFETIKSAFTEDQGKSSLDSFIHDPQSQVVCIHYRETGDEEGTHCNFLYYVYYSICTHGYVLVFAEMLLFVWGFGAKQPGTFSLARRRARDSPDSERRRI